MNGQVLKLNPPGGRGVLRLHEVKLLGPGEGKPPAANTAPAQLQTTQPQP
jgi:hypothetical protein